MPVSAKHPKYDDSLPDWILMRDAYKGERAVKDKGVEYLPPTAGMVLDGMRSGEPGRTTYEAYKYRAQFPDYVQIGVETLVGILNAKEATIKLPAGMEYLRARATNKGDSLKALLRKIHEQQLLTGRVGLLGDLPTNPDQANPTPYLAMYFAEAILNWDDGDSGEGLNTLNLVVLDESGTKRGPDLVWETQKKYRVLVLGATDPNETKAVYRQAVFEGDDPEFDESKLAAPLFRSRKMNEIPFVFINSKDNLVDPDIPPLLGLSRLCFSIYCSEADYRQTLFLQGQDTLVVIGQLLQPATGQPAEGNALRVGAGARIDVGMNGDAKFIGVSADGLSEQRTALETDHKKAAVRTGQLLAPGKMSMESGEALKTRVAAQTATLTSVALSSATGLERLLKALATWMGENPDEVKVTPNLDFTNIEIQGQDIVQLITAKNLGFPLSYENLHKIARERGLTTSTFEEEMELCKKDPEHLIKFAHEMSMGLSGNNPTQQAGGPAGSTKGKGSNTNANPPK